MPLSVPIIPTPTDDDGRQIVRPATAMAGATMYYSGPDFYAAQAGTESWSQIQTNPPFAPIARDWVTVKLFDSSGNILDTTSSPAPDSETQAMYTCVDTIVEQDIELIGGSLACPNVLPVGNGDSEWRIWVYVAPDIPYALGGSRGFVEDIALSDFYEGEDIVIDGRSPKLLRYLDLSNIPVIQYGMSLHDTAHPAVDLDSYLTAISYDGTQHLAGDIIILNVGDQDTTQWLSYTKKAISPYAGDATDFEPTLLNNGWYENKMRFIIKHPTGLNPSVVPADKAHFQIIFDAFIKWL